MILKINKEILKLYEESSKSISYCIETFLDSTPIEYSISAFKILLNFELKGELCDYELEDNLVEKINQRNINIEKNKLINIYAWMSFFFPEI